MLELLEVDKLVMVFYAFQTGILKSRKLKHRKGYLWWPVNERSILYK